ncbi:hypothetical protein BS50DRAFT_630781 [Corynespora cassiicola Philippines]|uniref:Phosphodiester glycosidase domain-containing protein n=1 Tax=Corynespora cassiicola Philippines TaxID=1448308 RepID=A0A2T2NZ53_CORCC|nr:hypothetical protein BS50DRAFT_630781 [Corynespora cassiicola Philippines]
MGEQGKLDVVKIANSALSVVGNSLGGTDPPTLARAGGDYILSNGGFFFYANAATNPNAFASVGPTSSTQHTVGIDPAYVPHYKKLEGEDNTYLWSGPSLKTALNLRAKEFQYRINRIRTPLSRVPGSLAHASQRNERLVIVIIGTDKYLFAYTASSRKFGVDLNKMRKLIGIFLQHFQNTALGRASQVLNLDGGGSIYLSWNSGSRERMIAAGDGGNGDFQGSGANARVENPRMVTTLLKITPR